MSLTFSPDGSIAACPVHGEDVETGWIVCWSCGGSEFYDLYEEDPLMYDEGDIEACEVCKGKGGFAVCAECNADNPDVEW